MIPSAMQAATNASGPGHAHYQRVGAPTGRMTSRPTTKYAGQNISPLMAGVLLFARAWKGNHTASKVPKGLGSVVITHGNNVGIKLGYRSFTAIRITPKTISVPGAKARSVPVAAVRKARNSRPKSIKGVPFGTPKVCFL